MVERSGDDADPASVPSIAALLQQYRDRTGASYEDMSKAVGGAISDGRLQQLVKNPVKGFPDPGTIRHLAELLHVSITTVLESFAVSLGLDVEQSRPLLAITLPPGTDDLTDRDRAAILAVVRQLLDARRQAVHPEPDVATLDAMRLAEPHSADSRTNH